LPCRQRSPNHWVCRNARLALGAVAPAPVRAKTAEEFLQGRTIDEDTTIRASGLALAGARPLGRNAYKIVIARAIIKRAILAFRTPAACPSSSEQPETMKLNQNFGFSPTFKPSRFSPSGLTNLNHARHSRAS